MLSQMASFHLFDGSVIFHCIHGPHLLYHLPVNGHGRWFHVVAKARRTAMNTGVHAPFWIVVFSWWIPRSRTAGSYGSSIFSFLRSLSIVLPSSCASFQSHQQCRRVPSNVLKVARAFLNDSASCREVLISILLFTFPTKLSDGMMLWSSCHWEENGAYLSS